MRTKQSHSSKCPATLTPKKLAKAGIARREAAALAPTSSASPSSSAPSTSASARITPSSTPPKPSPAHRPPPLGQVAERKRSSSSPASSSAAPPVSTTTPPRSSTTAPRPTLAAIYRKMHIPDDPLYYEKFYFTPGDLGFKRSDTSQGPIGTLVCWDQWYPEAARVTALQRRRDALLPHRHRLASQRKGRVRRGPVQRLADHAARARHRQRRLRRRRQPRRP